MKINWRNASAGLLSAAVLTLAACGGQTGNKNQSATDSTKTDSSAQTAGFDTTINGKKVGLYTLKNKNGVTATITNFGGRLVSLMVPDKDGKMTDVVVGFNSVKGYQDAADSYFGASIGRYGNRIGNAKFTLEGKEYKLPANNGPNTLHGGKAGFDVMVWDAKQVDDHTLELNYVSKDGEQGFPGNLTTKVVYDLTDDNSLKINYTATTDKTTVVNLTNHAYYNLNGEGSGTILNHSVEFKADSYTPVNETLIPTGKIEKVAGTPFDFTKAQTIGSRIDTDNEQLKNGKGYDHNFVLNKHTISDAIATIKGDKSGIIMTIYTAEPGLQFYTGNFMAGKNTFKGDAKDEHRTAFCVETQHYPDSPNQPAFPSTTLKPGATYSTQTIYKFSK